MLSIRPSRRLLLTTTLALLALAAISCGVLPFERQPAAGYVYGSGAPLRLAVIDEAAPEWTQTIESAVATYDAATPYLAFQGTPEGANIVITVRDYSDASPPPLQGYLFPAGVGGFAAVYDVNGAACNYPPATAPRNCSGEIATADVYLNDGIPPGSDIDARRERLLLHEFGHALGLTRHAPDLDIALLAQRYGWPE